MVEPAAETLRNRGDQRPRSDAMNQPIPHPRHLPVCLALLAVAIAALLAPAAAGAAQPTKLVAKKVPNEALGKVVLANTKGRTLYSLSAEKNGRWICTGSCTATWHPLLVHRGVRPRGPVKLGTIERPNGSTQVTYRGLPLYTFGGDTGTGQANGEGIKDVGTWHAASTGTLVTPQPPQESPPPPAPGPQPQPQPESPYPNPYPR
jgi:predicted lipoprotein with Yx(FWY)xxD motif